MLEQYLIDGLMIGNRVTVYNVGGNTGITSLTDGPYIFYKVPTDKGKKQKYMEIFTEEVYKLTTSTSKQKFSKTYVKKSEDIKKYLSEDEFESGIVTKMRLLDIYNKIRANSLENEISKIKKK